MSNLNDFYKLSLEEHNKIYERYKAKYLIKSVPQKHPIAIITGGQPGSGKSGLVSIAKIKLYSQGGFALIDADKMRELHPEYKILLQKKDREAANLAHSDAAKWSANYIKDAAIGRRNLIIDQTSKDTNAFEMLSNSLKKAGYRIEFWVLAVNELISEQRILMRYETQKEKLGYGRYSSKENHDVACAGLLSTADNAEKSKNISIICVYNQNYQCIYSNHLKNNEWENTPEAHAFVESIRNNSMTLQNLRVYVNNYAILKEMINNPQRNASEKEIIDVQKRYEQSMFMLNEKENISPTVETPRHGCRLI